MSLLYLSKPNGTHAVFTGTRSQGGYDVVKLVPGQVYVGVVQPGDFVAERDFFQQACDWADLCDRTVGR